MPFIALPLLGLVAGVYVLLTALSPMLITIPRSGPGVEKQLRAAPDVNENRLYIPKINVNVAILQGDQSALDKGAWHRYPDRGDPAKGGNFIVSAHRFSMGWTPQQTRKQSPFYNVGKLAVGDQIFVDYEGERYGYEISEKFTVAPDQIEIEAPSEEAKLTLYSCTLSGATDGRDVFVAKPLGKVEELSVSKR